MVDVVGAHEAEAYVHVVCCIVMSLLMADWFLVQTHNFERCREQWNSSGERVNNPKMTLRTGLLMYCL